MTHLLIELETAKSKVEMSRENISDYASAMNELGKLLIRLYTLRAVMTRILKREPKETDYKYFMLINDRMVYYKGSCIAHVDLNPERPQTEYIFELNETLN